jgi:hypothetical protein
MRTNRLGEWYLIVLLTLRPKQPHSDAARRGFVRLIPYRAISTRFSLSLTTLTSVTEQLADRAVEVMVRDSLGSKAPGPEPSAGANSEVGVSIGNGQCGTTRKARIP